jgi:hypothetical protein
MSERSDDSGAGLSSFLDNFADQPVSPSFDDDVSTPDSPDDAPDTDASAPDEPDDGQDFSAEGFVADQLAASMAEDGFEIPETDDEGEPAEAEDLDVEKLSPEEMRVLQKELREFKAQEEQARVSARLEAVYAKAAEAEAQALEDVRLAFEREVLSKSTEYYNAALFERLAGVVRAAKNYDDPDTYAIRAAMAEAIAVFESKFKYEQQKRQDWQAIADQARAQARQNDPAVRDFVARHFAQQYGLPEEVVADIADPHRHITSFEQRAQELALTAKKLGSERKKQARDRRQDANRALQRTTVRTSTTGRTPGGKARDWKDLDAQTRRAAGAAVLSTFD